MAATADTLHDLREQLDATREAYDELVQAWSQLMRVVRRADLAADFCSLYDRIDAYVPDSLGDVGSGQTFGEWLNEVDQAIGAEENR
jgi:hypothetical protein